MCMAHMSPDDRTALFEEMPASVTQRLLNLLPPDERKEACNCWAILREAWDA